MALVEDTRFCFKHGEFLKKLNAYLIWREDWKVGTLWDEIGEGDHPCQNPPELDVHDQISFALYKDCNNQFIKDFNLLADLFDQYGLSKDDKELLFYKLNKIHQFYLRLSESQDEEKIIKNGES